MRTIAVIGSNCFTGSHIVEALLERGDARVVGISRSPEYADLFLPYRRHHGRNFEFHQIDVVHQFPRLIERLDADRPDVVINVAALSEVALSNHRPVEYFLANTDAVVRLCNELRTRDYLKHYVHISSAEIFGSCAGALDETALFNPSTPYAVSKAAADMYLETLRKNFNFPAIIVRSTNVYGRHQQLFKIIPRTVIRLKRNETIELHGGGTSKKSFVHIRDVVRGLLLALDRGEPATWHFSVPSELSVADVVHRVCDRMGRDFRQTTRAVGERLGQDAMYRLDCTRAQRDLGWRPHVEFDAGIDEVIEWIEANWDEVQASPMEYQHRV